MQRPSRKPSNLPRPIHHQLNMYALAAGAAGVSMLALAQPSQAKIVYTPAHHVIGKNSYFLIDLNHDGIWDFFIYNSALRSLSASVNFLKAAPNHDESAGVEGAFRSPDWFFALARKRGARISGAGRFYSRGLMAAQCARGTYSWSPACKSNGTIGSTGNWVNVKNHYLGLSFVIHGKTHYGWARLTVRVSKSKFTMTATLTGYAYETIPGKGIIAGQTKGTDDIVERPDAALTVLTPEPATLGALAMGAPGLSIWRRKESVGATQ